MQAGTYQSILLYPIQADSTTGGQNTFASDVSLALWEEPVSFFAYSGQDKYSIVGQKAILKGTFHLKFKHISTLTAYHSAEGNVFLLKDEVFGCHSVTCNEVIIGRAVTFISFLPMSRYTLPSAR